MIDFEIEISDEQIGQLVRSEDPNEIARLIDEILEPLDMSVYSGYNDNYGYYIG